MNQIRKHALLLGAALAMLFVANGSAQAQEEIDWNDELTSRFTFNGYAQAGFDWNNKGGNETNSYNLKRTLFWAKARITDRWSFLFMTDFNSVVQEFYSDFRVTKNSAMTVRLGQFKNSLTIENPMSPTTLELVDVCSQGVTYLTGCGSDPMHGVNYGRDLGLKVFGDLFKGQFYYEAAVMSGAGINRVDNNTDKDYQLHLEYRPIPGLRFVTTGQLGTGHAIGTTAWNDGIGVGDNYRRNRYSAGVEYKFGSFAPAKYKEARPISLRGEWLGGKDGGVVSQGGYLTAVVPLVDGLDVVASGDYFDYNKDVTGWKQANGTIGIQYWFYKKCRLQLQYTRCICGSNFGPDYNKLQAQMQVAF